MAPKRAIVFGGSSGIGEASAAALLARGFEVTIVGRDTARLRAAQARLGPVGAEPADGRDRASLVKLFERAGRFDALVNCVSGGKGAGPFRELDLDVLAQAFEEKTLAQFRIAQVAAGYLNANASITFVTAASARSVIAGTVGLAAVNAALEASVKILAHELAPLRVNAVSPGIIDTPWWDALPAELRDAFFSRAAASLPVRRVGNSAEVGELVALIADSGFVTGSVYEIDGGAHCITQ